MPERAITIKFLGDSKGLTGAVKSAVSELDKTEGAGKRVAAALGKMADETEADLLKTRAAADKLAAALGTDGVAAAEANGRSVDQMIDVLRRGGLTLEEIEADVDDLAAAMRRLDDLQIRAGQSMTSAASDIDRVGSSARAAADDVDTVRDSADQSRSVLANMVGNTVQDLAGLGGVAGTAGMALGQIGEYATEGGISVGNLVKNAGPMLGLAAVGLGVAAAVKAIGKEAADAKKEIAFFVEQQARLKEGKYDEVAEELAKQYEGTIAAAKELGLTTEDVIGHMTGHKDITSALKAELDDLESQEREMIKVGGEQRYEWANQKVELERLITNLDNAKTSYGKAKTQTVENEAAVRELSMALKSNLAPSLVDTGGRVREFSADTLEAKEAAKDAAQAVIDFDEAVKEMLGEVDAEQAWLGIKQKMDGFTASLAAAKGNTDAERQAVLSLKEDLLTYVDELDNVPLDKKTKILALIDQEAFRLAEVELAKLEKSRFPVYTPIFRNAGPGGGVYGAEGGIVTRPTLAVIGEAGPEAVIPLHRTPGSSRLPNGIGIAGNGAPAGDLRGLFTVSSSGGTGAASSPANGGATGADELDLLAAKFERGDVSAADYLAALGKRQAGLTKYSAEEMTVWRTIEQVKLAERRAEEERAAAAKKAADEIADAAQAQLDEQDRLMAAMYETGRISRAEWQNYLDGRLGTFEEFSVGYMKVHTQLSALRRADEAEQRQAVEAAKKATDEALDAANTKAKITKELADALDAQQAASNRMSATGAAALAKGLSKEEREKKLDEFVASQVAAADSVYRSADAKANAAGLGDGTVGWSRMVRAQMIADRDWAKAAGWTDLAAAIDRQLLGIPELAAGGIVQARPGGTVVRVAEAGHSEVVAPLSGPGLEPLAKAIGKAVAEATAGTSGRQVVNHFHNTFPVAERNASKNAVDELMWQVRVMR